MHHSHHMNYLHPSDCDLNLTLKDMRRESVCSSTSNLEVSLYIVFFSVLEIPVFYMLYEDREGWLVYQSTFI